MFRQSVSKTLVKQATVNPYLLAARASPCHEYKKVLKESSEPRDGMNAHALAMMSMMATQERCDVSYVHDNLGHEIRCNGGQRDDGLSTPSLNRSPTGAHYD